MPRDLHILYSFPNHTNYDYKEQNFATAYIQYITISNLLILKAFFNLKAHIVLGHKNYLFIKMRLLLYQICKRVNF
jgi:hypothetical protein